MTVRRVLSLFVFVFLFVLVVVLVVGSDCVSGLNLDGLPRCARSVRVAWVVDGDTIVADGRTVRLADIDACEVDSPCGVEAHGVLIGLVYDRVVELECDGVDRFGRDLCVVSRDGRSVGDVLLERGLARKWVD